MRRLAWLSLVCTVVASGYVHRFTDERVPLFRTDETAIRFELSDLAVAGLVNQLGDTVIEPGSDPVVAAQAAVDAWNSVPGSRVLFEPVVVGTFGVNDGRDGRHTIAFDESQAALDVLGGAIGVALPRATPDGRIVDSDIYINPRPRRGDGSRTTFATDGRTGSFDLRSVITHELGHALGADHTGSLGATMYATGREGESFKRTLSDDDRAFAVDLYPAADADALYGTIRGRLTDSGGAPVAGGLVTAVDPATGVVVGGLTDLATGEYAFRAPAGTYFVHAEALDGPVRPMALNLSPDQISDPFQTAFAGVSGAPTAFPVAPGGVTAADLEIELGDPVFDIEFVGVLLPDGTNIALGTGPRELTAGERREIFLWGPGLSALEDGDLEILGPSIALVPGTLEIEPRIEFNGFPAVRAQVEAAAGVGGGSLGVPGGTLGTIVARRGGLAAVYAGALVLEAATAETPRPTFSAAGVVNAASFAPGVAPGGILTIFGADMGPEPGVAVEGFDPETGGLPTRLAGVEVRFDGVPAPLFFVSAGQINAQAPFEASGLGAGVTVSYLGTPSAAVEIPISARAPGIFVVPGTDDGVVINQDGTLNSPANPESRGRVVVIYATGQGAVEPPIATGQPSPASPPSEAPDVTVRLGDRPSAVLFGGMTPGFVGLMQVNARISADAPTGDDVPLVIGVEGVESPGGVTVAIAP